MREKKKNMKPVESCRGVIILSMLAFDIETKGLDAGKHDITVVCNQNFYTNERKEYEFVKVKTNVRRSRRGGEHHHYSTGTSTAMTLQNLDTTGAVIKLNDELNDVF